MEDFPEIETACRRTETSPRRRTRGTASCERTSPRQAGSGSLVQCRRSARSLPLARVSDRNSRRPSSAGVFPFALLGNQTVYAVSMLRRRSKPLPERSWLGNGLILPSRAREQAVFVDFCHGKTTELRRRPVRASRRVVIPSFPRPLEV